MRSKANNSNHLLQSVSVRPILPQEQNTWDLLMHKHHYLGFRGLVGESIRYVATYNDQWLALISWAAAALHCPPRDLWIGWEHTIKLQRVFLIANNTRFLILPYVNIPNLASKILSLNLKRLSNDWYIKYGHPIFLTETFVDPSRFSGTCYKAAGWSYLGKTTGYKRLNKKYTPHQQPKYVFVFPLSKNPYKSLLEFLPKNKEVKDMKLAKKTINKLWDSLNQIPDHRIPKGQRHNKKTILALSICAILCGARGYKAIKEWCERRSQAQLKKFNCRFDKNGNRYIAPSEATFQRFLSGVDAQAVDSAITNWIFSLEENSNDSSFGIDGKTLKGAKKENGKQVHLLSGFLHNFGLVFAQQKVDDKTNEINAVEPLFDSLNIEGKTLTADALLCQKKIATYLVEEKNADYLFTVKSNQKSVLSDIARLNLTQKPCEFQTVDTEHGRIETRKIWTSTALNDYLDFPYVQQVFVVERYVYYKKSQKSSREFAYGVTSLHTNQANPERLLSLDRKHWTIENQLHYVRDMVYDEDRSQIKTGNGPQVMASLKNLALNLLRLGNYKITKTVRDLADLTHLALRLLGI